MGRADTGGAFVDDDARPARAPAALLLVGTALLAVDAVLLPASAHGVHWAGYVLGTVGTVASVLAFRHLDLRRSASPYYVRRPLLAHLACALLVAAIVLASAHAWLALHSTRVL